MKVAGYKRKFGTNLRKATLCYLVKDGKVLLTLKKRGFAKGIINAPGGKVNDGESIENAAIREMEEEISVKVASPKKVAVIDFYFEDRPDWNQKVFVFLASKWLGKPAESEEVKPRWYRLKNIPYEKMWVDDIDWLPLILMGKKIRASYLFDSNQDISDKELKEVNL